MSIHLHVLLSSVTPLPVAKPTPVSPPTMKSLTLIKWKDKQGKTQRCNIISSICHKWQTFGRLIDMKESQIETISMKHQKDPEACCIDILRKWMERGSGDYPVSWDGLIELLGDLSLTDVAEELENALARQI